MATVKVGEIVAMQPTVHLRFVERDVIVSHTQMIAKTVKVLQQCWVDYYGSGKTEWRDVSLEKEEAK